MAVIEIAKIQVRRGQENQTGIPPLSGGEFAWAADTEQLYIGLRREDGGARDANVRILTENDLRNFFSLNGQSYIAGAYTYRSGTEITVYNSGTTIQTEYSSGVEFVRNIQDKLDDVVSIKDFGIVGDGGINSQDEYIQLAIDRLFLSTASEYSLTGNISPPAKVLHFPAGEYTITGTMFIPNNTTIIGEGIDKTVLILTSLDEHVFQTVDSQGRRDDDLLPGTRGVFTTTSWPDAIQKPTHPKNVHIEGMTIKYVTTGLTTLTGGLSLISLDCAEKATIRRVKFQGNFNENKIADENYSAIDIRGFGGAATSENIVIDDCRFENLYSGVLSNYDVNNITIQNSYFYKLNYGIAFNILMSQDSFTQTGPQFGRFVANKFLDIQQEAIYLGPNNSDTSTNHVSINNEFINVGNSGQSETWSTGTAVMSFLSRGNASVNDYFDRLEWQTLNGGLQTYNPLINGRAAIDMPNVTTSTVAASDSKILLRLPITGFPQHLTMKYSCYADLGGGLYVDRMGNVTYYIKQGSDPEVIVSDEYNSMVSDGGLYWGAVVDDGYKFIEITVFNPSSGDGGTGYPVEIDYQPKLQL